MNGTRALQIFHGFRLGQLSFEAKEIDELIKFELVNEADPRDLALLQQLEPAIAQTATTLADPTAPQQIAARLAEIEEKLKSSWARLTTRDAKVKAQETERKLLRRALAVLSDQLTRERLSMLGSTRATPWHPCQVLGDEVYALTSRGARVEQQLTLRGDRYGAHPLSAFMKGFDKTEAKMAAFSSEIATLSKNIGYVKKNPHQVVIGLAKTGLPATQAIGVYNANMRAVHAPDVAVTYARNAEAYGGAQAVAERIRTAQRALRNAGFVESPEVMGAAKTLLPYPSVEDGAMRFKAIFNGIAGSGVADGQFPIAVKCTARLMPADGTAADVVQRVIAAVNALRRRPVNYPQGHEGMLAAALASMVRELPDVEGFVDRFRQVEAALMTAKVCSGTTVNQSALECVTGPGTPAEVADTVQALAYQVANKNERAHPNAADVAVAASFAKRFAF